MYKIGTFSLRCHKKRYLLIIIMCPVMSAKVGPLNILCGPSWAKILLRLWWNILPNNLRTTNVYLGQFRKSCWNYYKTFSYDPDRPHASWTAYVIEFMCIYFFLLFYIFFLRWIAQYGSYCSLLSHPHCISRIDVLFFIYYFSLFCIYTVENRLN